MMTRSVLNRLFAHRARPDGPYSTRFPSPCSQNAYRPSVESKLATAGYLATVRPDGQLSVHPVADVLVRPHDETRLLHPEHEWLGATPDSFIHGDPRGLPHGSQHCAKFE